MDDNEKILSIINRGRLIQFIIGLDEFSYYYPEDGYRQWDQLIAFYNNAAVSMETKDVIRKTVVELFENPDRSSLGAVKSSIVAAMALSKMMDFDEITYKMIGVVKNGNVEYWDDYMKQQLIDTARHFKISELNKFTQKQLRNTDNQQSQR